MDGRVRCPPKDGRRGVVGTLELVRPIRVPLCIPTVGYQPGMHMNYHRLNLNPTSGGRASTRVTAMTRVSTRLHPCLGFLFA